VHRLDLVKASGAARQILPTDLPWIPSHEFSGIVEPVTLRQFEKILGEKVDVVFDLIGGDTQRRSFRVLKEGGHLVSATEPVLHCSGS